MTDHPATQISGFFMGGFGLGALFTSSALGNWTPGFMLAGFALLCSFMLLRRAP